MTRMVMATAVLVGGVAFSTGLAQQAPAEAPPAAPQAGQGRGGRGGGGGNGTDPGQSNEAAGVSVDRFMGYPTDNPAHFSHGGLITRAILSAGDPNTVGPKGAVLEYRKQVAVATLPARNSTPLMAVPDQYLFYVTSGTGRLEDGKQFWDLHQNIAMLIPPTVQRRFVNTSDEPLTMVMLQWEPAATPRADILVRDVDRLGYCEENAHWGNMSKCIFRAADGLLGNERMFLVQLQPFTWSAPHTHGPGTGRGVGQALARDGVARCSAASFATCRSTRRISPRRRVSPRTARSIPRRTVLKAGCIARGAAPPAREAALWRLRLQRRIPPAAPPAAAPPAAPAANQGRWWRTRQSEPLHGCDDD